MGRAGRSVTFLFFKAPLFCSRIFCAVGPPAIAKYLKYFAFLGSRPDTNHALAEKESSKAKPQFLHLWKQTVGKRFGRNGAATHGTGGRSEGFGSKDTGKHEFYIGPPFGLVGHEHRTMRIASPRHLLQKFPGHMT